MFPARTLENKYEVGEIRTNDTSMLVLWQYPSQHFFFHEEYFDGVFLLIDTSTWRGESPGDPGYEVDENQQMSSKTYILLVIQHHSPSDLVTRPSSSVDCAIQPTVCHTAAAVVA